ncbi:MAG: rRNA biogenesis protein rrp5 [Oscillospiraceae bacterium]|nr:rRNA biogenesis protein rrp5 [Oscillospiraceae bacterium]
METMVKIINALSALTAALQEFTEQTTNGYINTFEEIYNPEKDEPKEAPPTEQPSPETKAVTFVELRSKLAEISRSGHTAEVKELLQKFGAEKLSDVKESDFVALLAEAEGL